MTLHEAVADTAIKQACYDFLLARYEQDIVDDAYQQACTDMLKSTKPPTFASWEKARNYFVCAVNTRAGNIFHRQTLQIATSAGEFDGDSSPVSRVPDERPNALEAWVMEEEEAIAGEARATIVQGVQYILWNLPPVTRATIQAMLNSEKGMWIESIASECKCTLAQARGRLNNARKYFKRFEPLREYLAVIEGRHQPSERTSSEKFRTAV